MADDELAAEVEAALAPEAAPPWREIPPNMIVGSVPAIYATNVGPNGNVWIWIRQPALCIAQDFSPDVAEHLGRALIENARQGRALQAQAGAGIEVVKTGLLGPDGRPVL